MSKYGLVEAEEIPAPEDASRHKFRRGERLRARLQRPLLQRGRADACTARCGVGLTASGSAVVRFVRCVVCSASRKAELQGQKPTR